LEWNSKKKVSWKWVSREFKESRGERCNKHSNAIGTHNEKSVLHEKTITWTTELLWSKAKTSALRRLCDEADEASLCTLHIIRWVGRI
jgi:hypothetical protein